MILGHAISRNFQKEREYRSLVKSCVGWCKRNHLQLNTNKTKEMVIDFMSSKHAVSRIRINGEEIQTVNSYNNLGVHLDYKLNWATKNEMIYKKDQSHIYFFEEAEIFWSPGGNAPLLL